jgi:Putative NAD(P)-binding
MDYLPLFVDVTNRRCLLVGAGEVAQRRLNWLLSAGAHVVVVAPEVGEDVRSLCADRSEIRVRAFEPGDVVGMLLVIAATDSSVVNRSVYEAATAQGVLINTVDDASLSSRRVVGLLHSHAASGRISKRGYRSGLEKQQMLWAVGGSEWVKRSRTLPRDGASGTTCSMVRPRKRSTKATSI